MLASGPGTRGLAYKNVHIPTQICALQEREKLVAKVTRAWGNFGHHFHVTVTAKNLNFKDFLASKFLQYVFERLFDTITKSF